MDAIEILCPRPAVLVIEGVTVEVAPLRMHLWTPFAEAMGEALPDVLKGDLRACATRHHGALSRGLAIATGQDAAWIGQLHADGFVALLATVVEQNRDFFDRAVMPQVERLMQAFVPAAQRGRTAPTGMAQPETAAGTGGS